MSLLETILKVLAKPDLYSVFGLDKENFTNKALDEVFGELIAKQPKKSKKKDAKKKFECICQAHTILSNNVARDIYDRSNRVDPLELPIVPDFVEYSERICGSVVKPMADYVGSSMEKKDVMLLYQTHRGNMDLIHEKYKYPKLWNEERIEGIIWLLIESEDVVEFEAFTNETLESKRQRHLKINPPKKSRQKKSSAEPLDRTSDSPAYRTRARRQLKRVNYCETDASFNS